MTEQRATVDKIDEGDERSEDRRNRFERFRVRRARWVEPSTSGLPRWQVLWAFPILVALAFGIVVAAGITGSSSGYYYSSVSEGTDPNLIIGEPRAIRSDEWNIGTPLSIGQVQQGLPEVNRSLPGGQDAAIPMDLPRRDWSVIFRPHHFGHLILPLDSAFSWAWWIPLAVMLIAAYQFVVTVLPRRPELAALAAIGLGTAPFFQWWFQTVSFWPTAWGLTVMTAVLWALRSPSRPARWGFAIAAGYLTVVMAMGIYVPYIVPIALVVGFFVVGTLIGRVRDHVPVRRALVRIVPIVVAGATGAAITGVWLFQNRAAVTAFLGTSYPGDRSVPAGSGNVLSVVQTLASSFSEALVNHNGFLGLNSSEASTFFLFGAFVLPCALVAAFLLRGRIGGRAPWELIGLAAGALLLIAYALVPGWDALAHVLFLDRTTSVRLRIGLGVAAFAMIPFAIRAVEAAGPARAIRVTGIVSAALFLLSQVATAAAVSVQFGVGGLTQQAPFWWAYALASAASIALFTYARTTIAVLLVAAIGVAGAVGVNPLYRGVLDLRPTSVAKGIVAVDPQREAEWVAVGSGLPTALLIEDGMHSFSGTQGAPSTVMWRQVDPHDKYRYAWNRLGTVRWEFGAGEPVVDNPVPDVIRGTFDACSAFAQKRITYVVTDLASPDSPCLQPVKSFTLPQSTVLIFHVIPRP
jgi:hypothetical protein